MAGESRKIILYIFLFAVFVMLAMVLGMRIYSIYMGSKTTSEKTIKDTMKCAFSFSVSNIEYAENALSFGLTTSDTELLRKIVVSDEKNETREIALGIFIGYPAEQRIRVENINIINSFIISPQGCEGLNSKLCLVSSGSCKVLK